MTIMRVSVTGIKLQPEIKADLAKRLIEEFANVEVGQFSDAIAAGFTDGKMCWGRSETLDLDSRNQTDADLIEV